MPVYVSNEDYAKDGSASAAEKAERNRIYRESLKANLSTGTVHAYVLDAEGHPIDSLHVARAAKVEEMRAMLERTVEKLSPTEAKPLVEPRPQSAPPPSDGHALVLHLTARNLRAEGKEWVPVKPHLGETHSAGWGSYAAEDWIVLGVDEWEKLLPPGDHKLGTTWDMDQKAAAKILTHVYPSTENNDISTHRIERQELKAVVISERDGVSRARIDGALRMKHPFYHKDDDNFVEATLVGYLDFEPATKKIATLQLATTRATYGRSMFGAVVRSLP